LENLKAKPRPWKAHFHATIAIAKPLERSSLLREIVTARSFPKNAATGGFGYDPIFFFPELHKTMAELEMDEKNRLSHRARAVANAMPILKKMLGK
jgi:XTP/dITP diphosphohydrolase